MKPGAQNDQCADKSGRDREHTPRPDLLTEYENSAKRGKHRRRKTDRGYLGQRNPCHGEKPQHDGNPMHDTAYHV